MIGPTNALTVTGTVDPGSVMVGSDLKPVKLVNGVATAVANDLVDTASAQTIEGDKTLYSTGFTELKIKSNRGATGQNIGGVGFFNVSNARVSQIYADTDGGIFLNTLTSGRIQAKNQREYDPAHTDDIVTIGTLQDSTDVVHTTGNQEISGYKNIHSSVRNSRWTYSGSADTWCRAFKVKSVTTQAFRLNIVHFFNGASNYIELFINPYIANSVHYINAYMRVMGGGSYPNTNIHIVLTSDEYIEVWIWRQAYRTLIINVPEHYDWADDNTLDQTATSASTKDWSIYTLDRNPTII